MRRRIEQTMAQVATSTIQGLIKLDQKPNQEPKFTLSDYRKACEGLPVLILQSGLLATLAWLESSKDKEQALARHLQEHLSKLTGVPAGGLLQRLSEASASETQFYLELAVKAAVWQKRIAKALLPKDPPSKEEA